MSKEKSADEWLAEMRRTSQTLIMATGELTSIAHANRVAAEEPDPFTAPPDPQKFRICSHADMVKMPSPKWIVQGLLPQGEIAAIIGESGSGKSFLAYDIAASISRGIPWNGRSVQKGRALIVAAENSRGMVKRIAAYVRAHPDAKPNELPSFIADAPNFLDVKDAQLLSKVCASVEEPWSTIFVDTLASVMPGGNENSGESMGAAIGSAQLLHRSTGAVIVLIHHVGLSADAKGRGRGWSGFKAALDTEILVTRKEGEPIRTWKLSKSRDSEDGLTGSFRLLPVMMGEDENFEPISSCVVEHLKAAEVKKLKGHKLNQGQRVLVTIVSDLGTRAYLKEIVSVLKRNDKSVQSTNVKTKLNTLIDLGAVMLSGKLYSVPEPVTESEELTKDFK